MLKRFPFTKGKCAEVSRKGRKSTAKAVNTPTQAFLQQKERPFGFCKRTRSRRHLYKAIRFFSIGGDNVQA